VIEIIAHTPARVDRDVDRMVEYDRMYPSTNRVNFNPEHMQQRARGIYTGPLYVGRVVESRPLKDLSTYLEERRRTFGEIMEAFWFGVNASTLVYAYENILVPGTQWCHSPSVDQFCPTVFLLGENTISLGIELMKRDMDQRIFLEKGTLCLVMNA
jgi:hypothetical protein